MSIEIPDESPKPQLERWKVEPKKLGPIDRVFNGIRSNLSGSGSFMQAEGNEILHRKDLPPIVEAELQKNKEAYSRDGYYFNVLSVKRCIHPEGQEELVRYTIIVNNNYREHKGILLRWDYDIDIATQSLVTQRSHSRSEDVWFFDRDSTDKRFRYRDVPPESVHGQVTEAIRSHPGFANREELESVHIDSVREVRKANLLSEHPEEETVHLEGFATVHPPLKAIGKFLTTSKKYIKLQSVVPFKIQNGKVSLSLRKTSYEEEALYFMNMHGVKNLADGSPSARPLDTEEDELGPKEEPHEDDPADEWKKG